MKKVIFLFCGTGSQHLGMTKELYQNNSYYQYIMDNLDEIPKKMLGVSIIETCCLSSDKYGKFDRLIYTHPALFMVQYALAITIISKGVVPDYLLGSSLGESVSFAVAGVIKAEEMLECIIRQAQIIERTCPPGKMAAVIDSYTVFSENNEIFQNVEVVSINFNKNFLIAGKQEYMEQTIKKLTEKAITVTLLPVNYAFHTKYIEPAKKEVLAMNEEYNYRKPQIPILSSLRGDSIYEYNGEYLWNVIRQPICFRNTINSMDKEREYLYVDVGPMGTMANLVKYIKKETVNNSEFNQTEICSIINPFGSEVKNLTKLFEKSR